MSIRAELVLTKLVNIAYVESRNIQDEDIQLNCVTVCYLLEDRRQKCARKFAFCSCILSVFRRCETKWENRLSTKHFIHFFFYVNGTHEHDVGSNWGALWARLSGKASEDPLRWLYFKFVWQVQLCEFVSLPLAFTTDGINFYFSRQSVSPYRDSFDSRWVHLAPDPAGKLVDVGIESSRWTCSCWCTRQVCSSVRSRRPSSPHRWCSDFRLSRTPGVHLSHPAETQAYKRYSETCNFVHSKHTPDRSQCPPAEFPLRTCCCPAHPHRHEELCSVCPRWGKHKHSAGGCCISLKHEEKDINVPKHHSSVFL